MIDSDGGRPRRPSVASRAVDVALVAFVAGALFMTFTAFRDRAAARKAAEPPPPREVSGFDELISKGHLFGTRSAAVQILEFSDFQCPFCARVQAALGAVRREFPTDVAVIFRHFPLDNIHQFARPAAEAAECAGDQGRFEAMHDILFEQQDSLGRTPWTVLAARAGVGDTVLVANCIARHRHKDVVASDLEAGRRIDVQGTPAIIVNGRFMSGTPSAEALMQEVRGALRSRSKSR